MTMARIKRAARSTTSKGIRPIRYFDRFCYSVLTNKTSPSAAARRTIKIFKSRADTTAVSGVFFLFESPFVSVIVSLFFFCFFARPYPIQMRPESENVPGFIDDFTNVSVTSARTKTLCHYDVVLAYLGQDKEIISARQS